MLALLLAVACDPSLWSHTYHPQRFTIIGKCHVFTGTVEHERTEPDGDVHIQLRLDAGQGKPLNHGNMTKQNGCLVVEPVCVKPVKQADVGDACKGARAVTVPKVGAHVRCRGVYAVDNPHKWIELHAAECETEPR